MLLLLGVELLMLLPLLRAGEPLGDDLSIHLSEIAHLSRAIAGGDVQLWNPGGNLGFPSGYYYQVLPQLGPALAHVALPWLPLLLLFKLAILVPLALTPLTCVRALRVVGVGRLHALGGGLAVGCVLGASQWGLGTDSVFVTGLYTQAWAILFYPLALAYGARWLLAGATPGRAVGYAVLTGLCHPFVAFCLAPALALVPWWAAAAARGGGRAAARALGRAALLLGLVLAATAFFWLPILVHHDSFGGFPARLPSEAGIAPGTFMWWLVHGWFLDAQRPALMSGALALVVVAALVVLGRGLWRGDGLRWPARWTVPALLLAQGVLFGGLVMLGPLVGKVKDDLVAAVRFLAPMQLALAAAAGLGAVELMLAATRRMDAAAARPGSWLARRPGWLRLGPLLLVGVLAAVLVGTSARVSWWRMRTSRDFSEVHRDELATMIDALGRRPGGRVLGGREWGTGSHWWLYLPFAYRGVPPLRAWGGAALQSSPNFQFLREVRSPFESARVWGLRYGLVGAGRASAWPGADKVAETRHDWLLEARGAGAQAGFLFGPVRTLGRVAARGRLLRALVKAWLASGLHGAPREGWFQRDEGAAPAPGDVGSLRGARVVSEAEGLSRLSARVQAARATRFVVRVSYHPGWRAEVDGVRVPVRRMMPDVMAIDVPAGAHVIEMRFRRPWWTWLLMLATGLGFALHGGLRARGRGRA
ncbi:MAG: hypothetical protein IT370_09715 [Deltaproteobacteria bacterium]|nr:hypothetical protein [Deltaproteobacteria bacterium]